MPSRSSFRSCVLSFNVNDCIMTCVYEAEAIKVSCIFGNLESEVLSTTEIFMRLYIRDLEWLSSDVPSITNSVKCHQGVFRNVLIVVPKKDVDAFIENMNAVVNSTIQLNNLVHTNYLDRDCIERCMTKIGLLIVGA